MPLPDFVDIAWDQKPLGPEQDIHFVFTGEVWEAQSLACPDVLHRVNLIGTKGFCTCEDFRYRTTKTGKPCKHLRSLNWQARGKI